MNKAFFEILRPGINSTLQDLGRNNMNHIGIPFSGAMDSRRYLISNKLDSNNFNEVSLQEFGSKNTIIIRLQNENNQESIETVNKLKRPFICM